MSSRNKWIAYWVQFWESGGTLAQKTASAKAAEYYDASPRHSAKADAFIAEAEGALLAPRLYTKEKKDAMTHTTGLMQRLPDDEHRRLQGRLLDATKEMQKALKDAEYEVESDGRYEALCKVYWSAHRVVRITDEWLIELTPSHTKEEKGAMTQALPDDEYRLLQVILYGKLCENKWRAQRVAGAAQELARDMLGVDIPKKRRTR